MLIEIIEMYFIITSMLAHTYFAFKLILYMAKKYEIISFDNEDEK